MVRRKKRRQRREWEISIHRVAYYTDDNEVKYSRIAIIKPKKKKKSLVQAIFDFLSRRR